MTRRELRQAILDRMRERGRSSARAGMHQAPTLITLHPDDWEDVMLDPLELNDPDAGLDVYSIAPFEDRFRGIPVSQHASVARGEVLLTWPAG